MGRGGVVGGVAVGGGGGGGGGGGVCDVGFQFCEAGGEVCEGGGGGLRREVGVCGYGALEVEGAGLDHFDEVG